jgi:membrane protein implicated in regulation of membrane protease activity
MHALAWLGIALLALGVLGWLVFKITIWFAVLLFVAGIVFLIWGLTRVKRVVAGGGTPRV